MTAPVPPTRTARSTRTRRLLLLVVGVTAVAVGGAAWLASLDDTGSTPAQSATDAAAPAGTTYAGMRSYLDEHADALVAATAQLHDASRSYAAVVDAHDGDYDAVAAQDADRARAALRQARTAFLAANPAYEEMEGIVAGVPSLADFDVSLDAGAAASADPANAVDFDVVVDDDRTLAKPGNYFLLAESTLYGTNPDYASGVAFDVDDDGVDTGVGDQLPDAAVLTAVTRDFAREAERLRAAARTYEPTEADAFTALAVMTPTMGEYFTSWKQSQFVAGDAATEQGFVAASRLADVVGILGGLEVIRESLEPRMEAADPEAATAIREDLAALTAFVEDLRAREAAGTRFTAEQADRYGSDAQAQAEQVTARVTDIARDLGVQVEA